MTTSVAPAQALTFEETRERLAIGRSTLFRLVEAGEIKSFKLGRSRRFLAEDVDAFLRAQRGD